MLMPCFPVKSWVEVLSETRRVTRSPGTARTETDALSSSRTGDDTDTRRAGAGTW